MRCASSVITSRRRTRISLPWIVLFLVLAGLDWFAAARGLNRLERIARPAALLVLVAWFTFATGWQGNLFWFGLGLVFALLADVLLHLENTLLAGIIALLLGHLFYIIGFNPTSIPILPESIIMAVLVWGAAMVLFRRLTAALREREGAGLYQWPVMIYSLAISITMLSALATLTRPEWSLAAALLAALGGLLLFAFDGLMIIDRLVNTFPGTAFWERVAYLLAQGAILAGVLVQYHRF